MKLLISQEKGTIGRKYEHWASFLGTRNRLSNARDNPFPGGYGLSLLVRTIASVLQAFSENSYFKRAWSTEAIISIDGTLHFEKRSARYGTGRIGQARYATTRRLWGDSLIASLHLCTLSLSLNMSMAVLHIMRL